MRISCDPSSRYWHRAVAFASVHVAGEQVRRVTEACEESNRLWVCPEGGHETIEHEPAGRVELVFHDLLGTRLTREEAQKLYWPV